MTAFESVSIPGQRRSGADACDAQLSGGFEFSLIVVPAAEELASAC